MTNIEQKALALAIEAREDDKMRLYPDPTLTFSNWEALCRAIEQHEAFRQEVSDTLEEYKADQPYVWKQSASDYFDRFIIPKPKPDPLVGVLDDLGWFSGEEEVGNLRSALEARGLEIREKAND